MLCTAADVEDRLGRDLAPDEQRRCAGLIEQISLVATQAISGLAELSPTPRGVAVAISGMVAARLPGRTDGVVSETVGPFARRFAQARSGDGLSDDDLRSLAAAAGLPWSPPSKFRLARGW